MLDDRFIRPRLTKVGMIRAGLSPQATGKNHPEKLSTLRFTSAAEHLIVAIAEQYGGTPQRWQHPSQGAQWEVITGAKSVPVMVPRQAIDAWFELWGAKTTLQRRCTGSRVVNLNKTCLCDPDGTMDRDDPRRACSVVTRMLLLLADVPGLAGWGIESHGWNAVDEWGRYAAAVASMGPDDLWGATLQLQQRSSNVVGEDGKRLAREYMVPVVLFDHVTSRQLAGGSAALSSVLAGVNRSAVEAIDAGGRQAAIEAAPVPPVLDDSTTADLIRSIEQTATMAGLNKARAALDRYQLTRDHPVEQAFAGQLALVRTRAAEAGAPVETSAEPGSSADEPIDAEIVEEAAPPAAGRTATYVEVVTAAGRLKWSTSRVNACIKELTGVTPKNATPVQLGAVIASIEAM